MTKEQQNIFSKRRFGFLGYYISLVQKAQRVAFRFISLKHFGHFLVVGSWEGSLRVRATRAFIGVTTKK